MNVYVGITDGEWFDFLRERNLKEVNFWKPSGASFKALNEGDLFLFKLKAARGGCVAGGGFFVDAPVMTIDWAWRAFERENGVKSMRELNDRIWHYKGADGRHDHERAARQQELPTVDQSITTTDLCKPPRWQSQRD